MAAILFVVEVDRFQHGPDPFMLKSMAVSCAKTQTTYTKLFDTSTLLTNSTAALRTYQHQTAHHGLPLASPGLPESTQLLVLFHAIQETLLKLLQGNVQMPPFVILWVKGQSKVPFLTTLLGDHESPTRFVVRNLEDVKCPTAKQLRPLAWDEQDKEAPLMTHKKGGLFAEWLISVGLEEPRYSS